jgi:predicted transposase/invertase (TIGR01784 family)
MILDIDPKVDYAFKHLFGRETSRPLLVDLLNQVLALAPGHDIQDVELLNPFNPKESLDDKLSILDIKARDQTGRQFNVEMQMILHAYFQSRVVYYLTKFHQQQLHEGQDYSVLKPTISIVFLNEVQFPDVPDYRMRFRLLEERHHIPYSRDLEVHLFELPKFHKTPPELSSGLDIWLYFLRHAEKMDAEALPKKLSVPFITRAMRELLVLSQTDLERERYEARRKAQLDYNTDMKAARLEGLAEGEAKGKIKGKIEGLAEGKIIGVIQFCERLLKRPETPMEQLQSLSLDELTKLVDDLRSQVANRQ